MKELNSMDGMPTQEQKAAYIKECLNNPLSTEKWIQMMAEAIVNDCDDISPNMPTIVLSSE